MASDARGLRQRAQTCREMASNTTSEGARSTWLQVAEQYELLARIDERRQGIQKEAEAAKRSAGRG